MLYTINVKRGHNFDRKQEGVYGSVWGKQREEEMM